MTRPDLPDLLEVLAADRALAIVRAPRIPDVERLAQSLADGGIRILELTFTTPGLAGLLRDAAVSAERTGALVGAGTVTSADQARVAVEAGARFLVTPGLGPEAAAIAEVGHAAGARVLLGAFTASEVLTALDCGADVVKVFPARTGGPAHLRDLAGPFPDVPLVPSGGVDAGNAAAYLQAGALAVTAGTSVVAPYDVTAARWSAVTDRATAFCAALRPEPPTDDRKNS